LLALALAQNCCATVNYLYLLVALLGALAAHSSVNAFNEYFDYRSGLDLETIKTPFSGGSGTLVANPKLASATLLLAIASLLVVLSSGVFFIWLRGTQILPFGITGVLLVTLYTTHIVKQPLACLVAAGTGFGPVMIGGTVVALTGTFNLIAFCAVLPIFFTVNNLLLLNQLPDIDADRRAGRRTIPVVYGYKVAAVTYGCGAVLAAVSILAAVALKLLPPLATLTLVPLSGALPVTRAAWSWGLQTQRLRPYMAINVAIALLTPVALASSIWLG